MITDIGVFNLQDSFSCGIEKESRRVVMISAKTGMVRV
jgi:hypothetical protein